MKTNVNWYCKPIDNHLYNIVIEEAYQISPDTQITYYEIESTLSIKLTPHQLISFESQSIVIYSPYRNKEVPYSEYTSLKDLMERYL